MFIPPPVFFTRLSPFTFSPTPLWPSPTLFWKLYFHDFHLLVYFFFSLTLTLVLSSSPFRLPLTLLFFRPFRFPFHILTLSFSSTKTQRLCTFILSLIPTHLLLTHFLSSLPPYLPYFIRFCPSPVSYLTPFFTTHFTSYTSTLLPPLSPFYSLLFLPLHSPNNSFLMYSTHLPVPSTPSLFLVPNPGTCNPEGGAEAYLRWILPVQTTLPYTNMLCNLRDKQWRYQISVILRFRRVSPYICGGFDPLTWQICLVTNPLYDLPDYSYSSSAGFFLSFLFPFFLSRHMRA